MDGVDPARDPAPRRRGFTVRKDAGKPALKCKRTLMITDDAWERLSIHALRSRVDKSELVETLIAENCRRFVVQDRGGRPPSSGQASLADGGEFPVEADPVAETLTPSPATDDGQLAGEGEGTGLAGPHRPKRRTSQSVR